MRPTPDDTQCGHVNHSCSAAAKSSRLGLPRGLDLDKNHRATLLPAGGHVAEVRVVQVMRTHRRKA